MKPRGDVNTVDMVRRHNLSDNKFATPRMFLGL